MTGEELDRSSLIDIATKLGKEREDLEKRNRKRTAKGRPPLPDPQERADMAVRHRRYRTGEAVTVDGASALKLFEKRKAMMMADDDEEDLEDLENTGSDLDVGLHTLPAAQPGQKSKPGYVDVDRAVKEAEAARRVADMKNGRINHESVWDKGGQRLDGGDETKLPQPPTGNADGLDDPESPQSQPLSPSKPGKTSKTAKSAKNSKSSKAKSTECDTQESADMTSIGKLSFNDFRNDLYARLRESFAGLERSLSDLQGRVMEFVASSDKGDPAKDSSMKDEFNALLENRVPVTFDVGGAKMSFDAITVFHDSPCITVVSKIGSASIKPKPGARLNMTYSAGGASYEDDPVVFLGTRFELPMFGLAFIGFIREIEAGKMDVDAGISK